MQAKHIAVGVLVLTLALAAAGCSSRPGGQADKAAGGDMGNIEMESGKDMKDMTGMEGMGDMDGGKGMEGMAETGGHNERTYDVPPDAPKIAVSMKNVRFNPSEFKLKAGEPVRFAVSNDDTVAHDFMLMGENGFDTGLLEPGANKEIGWIPEKPGTYEAFCSQPGHKDLGMTAKITVE